MTYHPTSPNIREVLLDHRTKHGLTNAQLGKLFDVSPTFVSKYINDKLDRDPEDFDARVVDTLRSIAAKLDLSSQLFSSILTEEIAGRINLVRRTSDVAFIYGPAGAGKTCAALKYRRENPSTLYFKVTGRSCTAADLEAGIFGAMKNRESYKANQRRWPFMVGAMKGDGGAIIIDNSHRLDRSGRDWGFDFNEETGKAIIFVGNPEMKDKINTNDQQQSRIGVQWEANYSGQTATRQLPDVARRVAEQFSDELFAEEIADLAAFIATRDGMLRSVRKTVILARELAQVKRLEPRDAMREAHRNLARNYMLPTD